MEFDCKSMHHKCKAECCRGAIDFSKEFWERNQHKVITKPIDILEFPNGQYIIPKTESGYCSFLREDYQCNIYEERPDMCKNYGDESVLNMSCPYIKKNGEERSRQHRRAIQREVGKQLLSLNNRFKIFQN